MAEESAQQAAIKLIAADDPEADVRMARWTAATTLEHPCLMRVFHSGHCEIDGERYIYVVTEYAEEVLSHLLPDRALTPLETGQMLYPVLDALAYLHGKGYVHGHLKPANILVVGEQLKLSCDGIRRLGGRFDQIPKLTVYDPPEASTQAFSAATDIWGLGITLVETLSQHAPVWDRYVPSEPAVSPSIPQPFANIAQECLKAEPASRCTLNDIKTRLLPYPAFQLPAGKESKTIAARLRVTALIAAVLVVCVVFGVWRMRSQASIAQTTETQATEIAATTAPVQTTQGDAPVLTTAVSTPAETSAPTQTAAPAPVEVPVKNEAQKPSPMQAAASTTTPAAVQTTRISKAGAVKGAVADQVLPDVLPKAQATITGTINVKILVNVDASGAVSEATPESPGVSKYFATLAQKAAQKWRFKPAQVDGQAVASEWKLQFQFRQTGTEVTPVEETP
jgi:TonB family protein